MQPSLGFSCQLFLNSIRQLRRPALNRHLLHPHAELPLHPMLHFLQHVIHRRLGLPAPECCTNYPAPYRVHTLNIRLRRVADEVHRVRWPVDAVCILAPLAKTQRLDRRRGLLG